MVCSRRIKSDPEFISGGVTIVDSDFHPIDPLKDYYHCCYFTLGEIEMIGPEFKVGEVIIEDDVWIGLNATILKVTIGKGLIFILVLGSG
jgi:acetyltransferase-like isoleucine patch superfamily enzyme